MDGWNPHLRGVPTKIHAGVPPPLFVLQVMEAGRKPEWEEEHHMPVRGRDGEDDGGAPGHSTSRCEWELVPKKPIN